MGSLYRLGQKFVDFCNVVQQNQNSEVTVPSSKVLYDEIAATNTALSALKLSVVVNTLMTPNVAYTTPDEAATAHYTHIVFFGTWNRQAVYIVTANNGSTPKVATLMQYDGTQYLTIQANGTWGLKFTNTSTVGMPIVVYKVAK